MMTSRPCPPSDRRRSAARASDPGEIALDIVRREPFDGRIQPVGVALWRREHARLATRLDDHGIGAGAEVRDDVVRGAPGAVHPRLGGGWAADAGGHRGAGVHDERDVVAVDRAAARGWARQGEGQGQQRQNLEQQRHLGDEPAERMLREQVPLSGGPQPDRRHPLALPPRS